MSNRRLERSPDRKSESERIRAKLKQRKLAREENEKKEKRKGGWDVAPQGYEGMSVGEVAAQAPSVLQLPFSNTVNPQQLRQARRLYVGNIPKQCLREDIIERFFNTAMEGSGKNGIFGHPPVVGVSITGEKNYAFLEFEHSRIATDAMSLDGIILEGNTLKLRRPKDYVPLPESYKEEGTDQLDPRLRDQKGREDANYCSTTVPDSPWKLFCGGIPGHLTEEQVKELLSSFGALRAFNMVKETNKSKGYAFFEYQDHSVTEQAINGLHGMKIGDKSIIVQKFVQKTAGLPLPLENAQPTNLQAASCLSLQVPLAQILPNIASVDTSPSPGCQPVLLLLNCFRPKDLMTPAQLEDALADMREELQQHGDLVDLSIKCPPEDPERSHTLTLEGDMQEPFLLGGVGVVTATFASLADAINAQKKLSGRKFNGRSVVTSLLPENK